ncbi:MAG: dihydropteroate synthase [Proteobacteria bacterium]|nr:dihydropteroate synthase [Pseudomonadota bacterium]
MGILNLSPDSFSGDGLSDDMEAIVARAKRLVAEGADIIDIGGESTRPDSQPVSADEELRRVNVVAKELREQTRRILDINLSQLKESVTQIARAVIRITDGGPEYQNANWYKFEVIQTAQQTNKVANFDEEHFFTKASILVKRERLIFVTSFHHIGRDLSGVMEATAFAQLESYEASEDRERVSQDFFPCSLEPFVFTRNTKVEEISTSYERWLDSAIAIAIKEFGDRL